MNYRSILATLLTPVLLSCATQTERKLEPEKSMSIAIVEEFGFVNVTFELQEAKTITADDGSTVYVFYFGGSHGGKTVYAALGLSSEWDDNKSPAPIPIFGSDFGLYALNDESQNLIAVLRAAYGLDPAPGARMKESLNGQVISIGEKPTALASKRTELKAFFAPPLHEQYGEIYINIDPVKKRVEFNEKDPEYRKAVISALTAK